MDGVEDYNGSLSFEVCHPLFALFPPCLDFFDCSTPIRFFFIRIRTKNQVTTTSRSQSWEPNPQTTQLQCRTTRQVSQVPTSPQPMQNTVTSRTRRWNHKLSLLPHTQESDDVSLAMSCLSDMLLCSLCEPSACKPRVS